MPLCSFVLSRINHSKIAQIYNFSCKTRQTVTYLCNTDEKRNLHISLPPLPRPQPHACRGCRHRSPRENAHPRSRAATSRRRPARCRHPRHPLRLCRVSPQARQPAQRYPHHDPEQKDVSLYRRPIEDSRHRHHCRNRSPSREHPRIDL